MSAASKTELGKEGYMENVELGSNDGGEEEKDQGNQKEDGGLWSRALAVASPLLASRRPLPASPTRVQKLRYAFLCPPHSTLGRIFTYSVTALTVWASAYCVLGQVALPGVAPIVITIHGGSLFALLVLLIVSWVAGWLVHLVRLPPLLGMLLTGIVLNNVPGIDVARGLDPAWSSTVRSVALAVILLRAGLGLDPVALKKLSGVVLRLACCPCLVETLVVAVAARLLLSLPWTWGFMLGFVLAAVSPAVVVPCLLNLQEQGWGVDKGIPTLVIAAASVDDVLAISCFTILLGITFNSSSNLALSILQGPLEALAGIAFGLGWGALVIILPPQPKPSTLLRLLLLGGGALVALFGCDLVGLPGAGALAVLVMAFMAGLGWRRQGWTDSNPVSQTLASLWFVFQPLLFSFIGTEIRVDALDLATVGWGVLVLLLGLSLRLVTSYLAVMGGGLTTSEQLFVALAWLPKATVQAAIGPLALDKAKEALVEAGFNCTTLPSLINSSNGTMRSPTPLGPREDEVVDDMLKLCNMVEYGEKVLTIAVLVILITAPIGAIAIMTAGPKFLTQTDIRKSNSVTAT